MKCLDCPPDEDEYDDSINNAIDIETENAENDSDSVKTVSVKVNGKEIIRSETNSRTTKLEINKDGIITKTK